MFRGGYKRSLKTVPTCEHLFLVQIFDFWDIFLATIYEKSLTERSVRDIGGEDESEGGF